MKIGKFLKTTLAVVMALAANAATACQFGDVVPPVAAWMRYIYISGVNEPNNRIYEVSAPRALSYNVTIYPDNGTSYDASLECFDLSVRGKSEVTVDLPLTVYIAATERTLFHPGATGDDAPPQLQTADDARLTLYLQYRALPSLTWVTAATVRMETWQISALGTTGKPVFGSYTIDPPVGAGTRIQIRIYITAEAKSDPPELPAAPATGEAYPACPIENADPDAEIPDSSLSIGDERILLGVYHESIGTIFHNRLNMYGFSSFRLDFQGGWIKLPLSYGSLNIAGTDWTREQITSVIVSGKRRPGK